MHVKVVIQVALKVVDYYPQGAVTLRVNLSPKITLNLSISSLNHLMVCIDAENSTSSIKLHALGYCNKN
jgi:hypothetical protein